MSSWIRRLLTGPGANLVLAVPVLWQQPSAISRQVLWWGLNMAVPGNGVRS